MKKNMQTPGYEADRKIYLFTFLISTACALLFSIVILLIGSFLLTCTSLPNSSAVIIIGFCVVLSAFVAGYAAAKKLPHRGFISGLFAGVIYFLVIYIFGIISCGIFDLNLNAIIHLGLSVIFGALGGIISVNKGSNSKSKRR